MNGEKRGTAGRTRVFMAQHTASASFLRIQVDHPGTGSHCSASNDNLDLC